MTDSGGKRGRTEQTVRNELKALGVSVESSTRAALAVNLARRVDDPGTSAAGAAAIAGRLDMLLDRVRSLRVPGPDVAGDQPAEQAAPVADAVAKARAAREARRAGGA